MDAVEDNELSSLCLLDVSSGFDTVSHIYLLRKLELHGYDDKSLAWINSYLKNRQQIVQVQASRSRTENVEIGFPQGGPLCPGLFRDYSTDIPSCITEGCVEWEAGESEDFEEEPINDVTSSITKALQCKTESEMTKDEKLDQILTNVK